jgi:hypothetical protein
LVHAIFSASLIFGSFSINLNFSTKRKTTTCCAHQIITKISNQLRFVVIKLIEVTPEESAAAKARLDAHNAKRRERHARKKH